MPSCATTVIFLHIPKTAGTTFCKIFERNYPRRQTLTIDGVRHRAEAERFANSPESKRAGYRLIQGHMHFGLHQFIPGNSTYVTCLREPIARSLSFYSYARSHSDHYLYDRIIESQLSLRDLLERQATPELFNHQTRMIAGNLQNLELAVDRSALERAKENLAAYFSLAGLTEEFDASVILLSRMFGWNTPFYVKKNVTRERIGPDSIDAQTNALLRKANALDIELHQYARTLFQANRQAAGPAFEAELQHFQELNSTRSGQRNGSTRQWSGNLFGRGAQQNATLKPSANSPSI